MKVEAEFSSYELIRELLSHNQISLKLESTRT